MPVNNQSPNSEKDIRDKITRFSESLGDTSFKGVNDLVSIVNDAQLDSVGLLRKLTEDIDRPLLKTFSTDMINFLGSFYGSEEVLCCLLKNLIIMSGAGDTITEWREAVKKFKEGITGEEEDLGTSTESQCQTLPLLKL